MDRSEWVLVPRVPTEVMIEAAFDADSPVDDPSATPDYGTAYAAMLAAAPPPPAEQARPDDSDLEAHTSRVPDDEAQRIREAMARPDGGVKVTERCDHGRTMDEACDNYGCDREAHPAPAPAVARLVEAVIGEMEADANDYHKYDRQWMVACEHYAKRLRETITDAVQQEGPDGEDGPWAEGWFDRSSGSREDAIIDASAAQPESRHEQADVARVPDAMIVLLNHLEDLMDAGKLAEDAIPVAMWNAVSMHNVRADEEIK